MSRLRLRGGKTPDYYAQSLAVFAAMAPAPTLAEKRRIDKLVRVIVDCGYWPKADYIKCAAITNQRGALINWARPQVPMTIDGAGMTFTPNFYDYGNAVDSLIRTGVVPNGSTNTKQDDHGCGQFAYEDAIGASNNFGAERLGMSRRATANSVRIRSATTNSSVITQTGGLGTGLGWFRRNNSANFDFGLNKATLQTVAAPSESLAAIVNPMAICGGLFVGTDQYSPIKESFSFGGAYFNDTQRDAISDGITEYMRDVGAVPQPDYAVVNDFGTNYAKVAVGMPGLANGKTITIEWSLTADFATILSTVSTPAVFYQGSAADYCTAFFDLTGASPNTDYYYRLQVGGVREPVAWRVVKTLPTEDVAAAYSHSAGSCFRPTLADISSFNQLAALRPLFHAAIGDNLYPNYAGTDVRVTRDVGVRAFHTHPAVSKAARYVPFWNMVDNHDSGDRKPQWRTIDFPVTYGNVKQTYREFTRVPVYVEGTTTPKAMAFKKRVARTTHYFVDTRGQRIYGGGSTTQMLGDGVPQPSFNYYPYDHKGALFAAMDAHCAIDPNTLFFIHSPTTLLGALVNEGWSDFGLAEWRQICDYIMGKSGMRVVVDWGDAHMLGIDSDTSNLSTIPGTSKIISYCNSPTFNSGTFTNAGPFFWNGGDGRVGSDTTNGQSLVVTRVLANNRNAEIDFYQKPVVGGILTLTNTFKTIDIFGA